MLQFSDCPGGTDLVNLLNLLFNSMWKKAPCNLKYMSQVNLWPTKQLVFWPKTNYTHILMQQGLNFLWCLTSVSLGSLMLYVCGAIYHYIAWSCRGKKVCASWKLVLGKTWYQGSHGTMKKNNPVTKQKFKYPSVATIDFFSMLKIRMFTLN